MNRSILFLLAALFWPITLFANARVQGDCMQGGYVVTTQGTNSTTRVMKSFVNLMGNTPTSGCTVTVFITGSGGTKATLTANNTGNPTANPFTADATGHWYFEVADGTYDATMSGAGITAPFTLGAITAFDPNAIGALNPMVGNPLTGRAACVGDGVADDTACWTATISEAIAEQRSIVCYGNTFLVSRQGTTTYPFDGQAHPYVFLIQSPLNISGNCNFTNSMTDSDSANVFVFKSTQRVRISGLTFTGTGAQTSLILYAGAGVDFVSCSDCYADHISTWNMRGNQISFNSVDTGCSSCFSSATPPGSGGFQGAHWGCYACTGGTFSEVTGYGGTRDGDLSFFGQPGIGNRALNSHLYNYAYGDATRTVGFKDAQGFIADSGQIGTTFIGNYAYGYYFCFDIKAESNGSIVMGNTAQKCKVSIDVRLGENPILTQSTTITGNIIEPLGGNGEMTSFSGLTATLGIWVEDSYGVIIANNIFETSYTFGAGQQDYIPIYAQITSTDTPFNVFSNSLDIHDNVFAMEQQQGPVYTYADNSIVVVAGNPTNQWPGVKIHDNTVKLRNDAAITKAPFIVSYATDVSMNDNFLSQQVDSSGLYMFSCANCTRLKVRGNHMSEFGGFLSVSNSDQISVTENLMTTQIRDLTMTPIPLILSSASTNWIVQGNQRTQYPYPSNVDNGRFFQSASGDTTANVVISDNIMYQNVFETDWYEINGVLYANTSDLDVLRNLRLGPINGPMRTYIGITGSLGGSSLSAGQCSTDTSLVITGAHSSSGNPPLAVDIYPTTAGAPGNGFYYKAYIADGGGGSGVVTAQVCAAAAGTPTATTYFARIHQ